MAINRARLQKFSYILNSLVFFSGFWSMFENEAYIHSAILLIATFLNLFLYKYKAYRDSIRIIVLIQIINAATALLTAYDYFLKGSNYIHFLWFFAALVSLAVIPLFIQRQQKG